MGKFVSMLKENLGFALISVAIMVAVYLVAFASEKIIEKKTQVKFSSEKTKINKMVIMAMLSAVAVVLMYLDFPLPIAPSFYKLDFSEIPVLIGSFMLGPCAGVAIEAVKVIIHLALKGTATAFVGDFANFILGCMYVVPAAIIYHTHKTKKGAIISLIVGGAFLIVSGTLLNAWYLLPTYAVMYFGELGSGMTKLLGMGSAIYPVIGDNVLLFVTIIVAPFNLIKSVIDGVVTSLLYKHLSKHIKAGVSENK